MSSTTQTETIAAPLKANVPEGAEDELISNLESVHTLPLWAQMAKLNPPAPNPTTIPHVWKYDTIRPHLLRAGEIISEKKAERRVLMLINPARSKLTFSTRRHCLLTSPQRHHTPPTRSMQACSSLCQMKRLQLIGILLLQCGSSSREMEVSLPSMDVGSRCSEAMLS